MSVACGSKEMVDRFAQRESLRHSGLLQEVTDRRRRLPIIVERWLYPGLEVDECLDFSDTGPAKVVV